MADSCSSPESEAKRAMAILRRLQTKEKQRDRMLRLIRERAGEDMALKDNTKKAEAGISTKRIRCDDAEVKLTGEPVGVNSPATKRGRVFQINRSQPSPSFVKVLLGSDLNNGNFLDLPKEFGSEHFPRREGSVLVVDTLLVDEHEQEYMMDYSFSSHRFLGKWRDFYLKHKPSPGDALVFYQIENYKFKVKIVKAYSSKGIANAHEAGFCSENAPAERSNDQNYESILKFEDIKSFNDFKIYLNGKNLDSQVPEHVRTKYFKLCRTQKKFLHEHLIKEVSSNEVSEMIVKTINIVEATKAVNVSTSLHHLEAMEEILKSFEDVGMGVGFLRDRIKKLIRLLSEHQTITDSKKTKSDQIRDEKTALGQEVSKLDGLIKSATARKSLVGCLEAEVDSLEKRSEELEFTFKEIVDNAWRKAFR